MDKCLCSNTARIKLTGLILVIIQLDQMTTAKYVLGQGVVNGFTLFWNYQKRVLANDVDPDMTPQNSASY